MYTIPVVLARITADFEIKSHLPGVFRNISIMGELFGKALNVPIVL